MSSTVLIPDVPEGLEQKRDRAIAALVIKQGISLQAAAEQIEQVMAEMDKTIKATITEMVGPELERAPDRPEPRS